ncbi:MAG: hypothetical protein Q4D42_13270, partial [Eubacteriales bacterium]|nr:hypothetical protein [Eubacteriales bacterium]
MEQIFIYPPDCDGVFYPAVDWRWYVFRIKQMTGFVNLFLILCNCYFLQLVALADLDSLLYNRNTGSCFGHWKIGRYMEGKGENVMNSEQKKGNLAALLPIGIFLVLYLGSGILFEYILHIEMGFYQTPAIVAFLIALFVACVQNRQLNFDEKMKVMAAGVGDTNILT